MRHRSHDGPSRKSRAPLTPRRTSSSTLSRPPRGQGQGIANSVGLAIAAKQLAAQYNKPNFDVVSNKIWCFTGDGCLQEGVGQEGESLRGSPSPFAPFFSG